MKRKKVDKKEGITLKREIHYMPGSKRFGGGGNTVGYH
jgi:hypothetical protein